eukprot:585794-Rhodomonas_salina.2
MRYKEEAKALLHAAAGTDSVPHYAPATACPVPELSGRIMAVSGASGTKRDRKIGETDITPVNSAMLL